MRWTEPEKPESESIHQRNISLRLCRKSADPASGVEGRGRQMVGFSWNFSLGESLIEVYVWTPLGAKARLCSPCSVPLGAEGQA